VLGSSVAWRCARVVIAGLLGAGSAYADHCQPPGPLPPGEVGLRVAATVEAAHYDYGGDRGNYQGTSLGLGYERSAFRVQLSLPAYRLTRNDDTFYGLGDATADGRFTLLRTADDSVSAGLGLTAMAPTGSAARDLGMGHVMLMPAVWGLAEKGGAFVQLQLAFARALSRDAPEHAHHAEPRLHPIVRPMNTSELVASASAGYPVHELLRVQAGLYTALPVDTPDGESRAVASAGVDFIPGTFDLALEAQAPVVGDPFTLKGVATAGARF